MQFIFSTGKKAKPVGDRPKLRAAFLAPLRKFLKRSPVPDISGCNPPEPIVNRRSSNSSALKLIAESRPLIIGHRGYCAIAPENTLPSFLLALNAGADLVELDYHETKDGVPLVIHDDTLDRTTDARKRWNRKR